MDQFISPDPPPVVPPLLIASVALLLGIWNVPVYTPSLSVRVTEEPFRLAVGTVPSAGVTEILTSVPAANSEPLDTALPLALTLDVPLPLRLMVSLGALGVTLPEPLPEPPLPVLFPALDPPVASPVEEP